MPSEDADGDALTFTWRTQHHDEGYRTCYFYNRWAYTTTATLALSPATSGICRTSRPSECSNEVQVTF